MTDAKNAYEAARKALKEAMMAYEEGHPALEEASSAFVAIRAAYLRAVDEDFQNRTKLLQVLINRLGEVIDDVEADPIGDVLDTLNNAAGMATTALEKVKAG